MSRFRLHAVAALALIACPSLVRAATLEAAIGVRGAPGQQVAMPITLRAMGQEVVATQNDLGFDSRAPIDAEPDGAPDCAVNAMLDKEAAIFAFQPAGCGTRAPCTAVRAIIVSLTNLDAIPDGALLYTCQVAIAADAPLGTYALTVDEVVLVDEEANELAGALGTDGSIVVEVAATATPTSPPTTTPTPTVEPSGTVPATATATASETATPPTGGCGGGDCNGDGTIAINELIVGVSIALGASPLEACPSFAGGDGQVGITDLIAAVNDALSGCA